MKLLQTMVCEKAIFNPYGLEREGKKKTEAELEKLQREISEKFKSVLGLQAKVTLVQPKTLERFQGKAKRILDLRNE